MCPYDANSLPHLVYCNPSTRDKGHGTCSNVPDIDLLWELLVVPAHPLISATTKQSQSVNKGNALRQTHTHTTAAMHILARPGQRIMHAKVPLQMHKNQSQNVPQSPSRFQRVLFVGVLRRVLVLHCCIRSRCAFHAHARDAHGTNRKRKHQRVRCRVLDTP